MTAPLKIAVLLNGFVSSSTPTVRAAFESAIKSASSLVSDSATPPTIDYYDPIVAQIHPDPTKYDLIVLSGGTADPMGSDPWVLKLQKYLREVVTDHPKQKIVGICWGHQTTSVSFGGSVGSMTSAEIGVTQITLTAEGKRMFPFAKDGTLDLHEFHAREIKAPAEGFVALAEGNQSFVNNANTVLTFQGHPELNLELAKLWIENAPSYMRIEEGKEELVEKAKKDHDGVRIWARILQWVRE